MCSLVTLASEDKSSSGRGTDGAGAEEEVDIPNKEDTHNNKEDTPNRADTHNKVTHSRDTDSSKVGVITHRHRRSVPLKI